MANFRFDSSQAKTQLSESRRRAQNTVAKKPEPHVDTRAVEFRGDGE